MKTLSALILSAAMLSAILSACATAPDPAKVCTSEWIGPRADRAVSRIESRASGAMKSLSKASKSWAQGKTPGPLTMMSLSSSLKKLERELKDGRGMRDLKTLSATCNDPQIVSDAMSSFLRRQGLSEKMASFIEGLELYQSLLAAPIQTPAAQSFEMPTQSQNMMHH